MSERKRVVLDLTTWLPEYVARIPEWLREVADAAPSESLIHHLAAQIEAQTKPPRIPEPGLWGVVKTVDGEFVNVGPGWLSVEYGGLVHQWPTLRSPVLIREGVES